VFTSQKYALPFASEISTQDSFMTFIIEPVFPLWRLDRDGDDISVSVRPLLLPPSGPYMGVPTARKQQGGQYRHFCEPELEGVLEVFSVKRISSSSESSSSANISFDGIRRNPPLFLPDPLTDRPPAPPLPPPRTPSSGAGGLDFRSAAKILTATLRLRTFWARRRITFHSSSAPSDPRGDPKLPCECATALRPAPAPVPLGAIIEPVFPPVCLELVALLLAAVLLEVLLVVLVNPIRVVCALMAVHESIVQMRTSMSAHSQRYPGILMWW
jgi:hypothetical protein